VFIWLLLACRDKPLAMYIFSNNKPVVDRILTNTSSGGVTVNDTLMHPSCELDHVCLMPAVL